MKKSDIFSDQLNYRGSINDMYENLFLKYAMHLTKNLSEKSVLKYMEMISTISPHLANRCSSLLLYPITQHLMTIIKEDRYVKTSDLTLHLVNCLDLVLAKSKLESVDHLFYLNNILVSLIHSKETNMTVSDKIPEELKLGVVNCKIKLYRSLHQKCFPDLYDLKNSKYRQMMAASIYFCLELARNEKLLALRLQALHCVLVISKLHEESDSDVFDDLNDQVRGTLATMMPGVVSACLFIVQSGSILHHKLYMKVLELFGKFIALIMKDKKIGDVNHYHEYMLKRMSTSSSKNQSSDFGTDNWFSKSRENLTPYMSSMMSLRNFTHWKIRHQLTVTIEILLTECFLNLGMLVTPLIETAIILRSDEVDVISKKSNQLIENLLTGDDMRRKEIIDFLEENFHVLLCRIHSTVSFPEDNRFASELNLLNGYLDSINLVYALRSPSYLELLCSVLIHIFRMDALSFNSFQNRPILELNQENCNISLRLPSWLRMKYVVSDNIFKCALRIFDTISKKADLTALSQYLFEIFNSCPRDRKEIIFIINSVCFNSNSNFVERDFKSVKCMLQMYLNTSVFDVPIAVGNNIGTFGVSSDLSSSEIYNNVLQVCLLVDGIGKMAVHMGKDFRPLLFNCLYHILEKAGSQNEFVSSAGNTALFNIIQSCGYDSISQLLSSNLDYVTHFVIRNLTFIRDDQKLFDVLSVIIERCSQQSLPSLCDIMDEILRKSDIILIDSCQEGFLKVFKFYTRKIRSWFVPIILSDRERINDCRETYTSIIVEMDKYMRKIECKIYNREKYDAETTITIDDITREYVEINHEDNVDRDMHSNDQDDANDDTMEEKVPRHIETLVKICENVIHLLPFQKVTIKVAVIEILMDSLLILATYENKLLPIVHKIWSPLVTSVAKGDLEPLILRQSFELLCIMAVTARDFIKSRTLKEIFPSLTSYLQQTASQSVLKDKNSVYRMSQQYKLQLSLLQELGHLAVYIDLQEKQVQIILKSVTSYLSSKQSRPLQTACIELHRNIGHHHYGLVWTHLLSIWTPNPVIKAPEELKTRFGFKDIMIKSCTDDASEYKRNVLHILNLI